MREALQDAKMRSLGPRTAVSKEVPSGKATKTPVKHSKLTSSRGGNSKDKSQGERSRPSKTLPETLAKTAMKTRTPVKRGQ